MILVCGTRVTRVPASKENIAAKSGQRLLKPVEMH
jgi:hypothetical protein